MVLTEARKNALFYEISLLQVPGVGHGNAKLLISYCNGAEAVFGKSKSFLAKIPGIGEKTAEEVSKFRDFSRAEKELIFLEKSGVRALSYYEADFPARLKNLPDCPVLIFSRGNFDFNKGHFLGIVGTRKPTDYGKNFCSRIIEGLKASGIPLIIVSGLAYGIDGHAHRESLRNEIPTLGVVAHGLDTIYPPVHAGLARQMEEKGGGLVSENLSATKPDKENFPKRNRIIAGLIDALLVVETKERGGSIITARLANDYNREVFALPGSIHNPTSLGCHLLIKENLAALADRVEDLLFGMGWQKPETEKVRPVFQPELFVNLTPEEEKVLEAMKTGANSFSIEDIVKKVGYSSGQVFSILLNLEFKGVVIPLPGNMFRLSR